MRDLPANPLWILLHSWQGPFDRRFLADVIVNIALYVPLGMAGRMAFRKGRNVAPVALGAIVSGCIEMVQLYTPGRTCSGFDFADNIAGSALGVFAGAVFEEIAGPAPAAFGRRSFSDRAALFLLFCWVGSLMSPFFPVTRLFTFRNEFALFAHADPVDPVRFVSAALSWLVAGRLLIAAGFESVGVWLGCSLLLVPAQFLIVSRQPLPVDFLGSAAGFILFLIPPLRYGLRKTLAAGFLMLLLLRGLVPFHVAGAHEFVWLPFGGLLGMDWQEGMRILLEKAFYYGAAIWLLRATGLRWRFAIAVVAIVLGAIELVQIRLPGRTAELTDPILAVMIGPGLKVLSSRRADIRHPCGSPTR